MDPFAAIGLVSNILSFIGFSMELLRGAGEIYGSLSGTLEENRSSAVVVGEMKKFSSRLLTPDASNLSAEDKELCNLAAECRTLSSQLIGLLEKIKPKDPKSKSQSIFSALKNKVHEKEKQDLEQRLDYCRSQLELQLNFLGSRETSSRLDTLVAASEGDSSKLERLQGHVDQLRQGVEVAFLSPEALAQLRRLIYVQEEALNSIAQERILKSLEFEGMHMRHDMVGDASSKTFQWIFTNNGQSHEQDMYGSEGDEYDSASTEDELQSVDATSQSDEEIDEDKHQYIEEEGLLDEDMQNLGENDGQSHNEDSKSGYDELQFTENEHRLGDDDNNQAEKTEHQSEDSGHESKDGDDDGSDEEEPQTHKLQGQPMEDEAKRQAREVFINWLSSGDGIFHISGKLGSGKSTLMKFLCSHRRTKTELAKWAGERTLVFANFFFWAPGSERQKSLTGLYCALLHDILQSCPELIPQVLPIYWNKALSTPWQIQKFFEIPDNEIRKAFTRLIKSRRLGKNHCFCFFIDGLDEFQETTQDDHKGMVDLLCLWTTAAPGRVKLCVSSREYNAFINAFDPTTRLRLHDLTRQDMRSYIQDKLNYVPDQTSKEILVNAITDKAQGIFLWVALVVKSMREQLENGYTIAALREELDTLPEELDGLFAHILKSLKKPARKNAYVTLAMLTLSKKYDLTLPLFAYSFLDEYERNPEFAMTVSFPQLGMGSMTREDRLKLAEKRLIGWCRGLVERDSASNLEYTHRSVSEFLQTATIRAELASLTNRFNVADAISQLVLADVRLQDLRSLSTTNGDDIAVRVTSLIHMRRNSCLDQPPYSFLDCLGSSLNPTLWEDLEKNDGINAMCMMKASGRYSYICSLGPWQEVQVDDRIKAIMAPLYIMTHLGYHEYPMWKVLHDPTTTDTVPKIILLVYCCMNISRADASSGESPNISVLQLLFERNLLSPNIKTHLWSIGLSININGRILLVGNVKDEKASAELTIWQHYLLYLAIIYRIGDNKEKNWQGQIIEAFLRHKPDLDFTLSITGPRMDLVLELKLGKDQQKVLVPLDAGKGPLSDATRYKDLSPREWIKLWKFENKERLLQLLDSRIKELESVSEEKTVMTTYVETRVDQIDLPQGVDQRIAEHSRLLSSERSIGKDPEGREPASDQGFKRSRSLSGYIDDNKYLFVIILGVLVAILVLYL